MKHLILTFVVCALSIEAKAQLTIERCQELARAHYPMIQRYGIIEQTTAYNLANIGKGHLPQAAFNVRASYQSDVTSIPAQLLGIHIDGLPKDQYLATLDISQSIWDGGVVRAQREVAKAGEAVEQEQLKVEIYALEKRVNQLFFGILLWEAYLNQNKTLQTELGRSYAMVDAFVQNGIANQVDLDAVAVEQLKAQQQYQQLLSGRKAYIDMLALMIGQVIDESTSLEKPNPNALFLPNQINRPELKLFDAQSRLFETQKSAITTSYMPKFSLFVQGGYGRPGLNMLSRDLAPFYIGGVRMMWNFGALYTQKNDRLKLELNQQNTAILRDVFLYHTNLEISQQNTQIDRLRKTMQYDDEIIVLRENIRKAAEVKVANGTLSVTELMRELHAEHLAKQEKMTHEIELITAIYDLKYSIN